MTGEYDVGRRRRAGKLPKVLSHLTPIYAAGAVLTAEATVQQAAA